MALSFKTASDVTADYLTKLKATKPNAIATDVQTPDNDWWIRGKVTGGVVAGLYSDQALVSKDAFPQSARRDAVLQHLFTYFAEIAFRPATPASGTIAYLATNGSTIPVGQQAVYDPTGGTYQFTTPTNITTSGTGGTAKIQSLGVGQVQNLAVGATLRMLSPPPGVNPTLTVVADALTGAGIGNGTDEEQPAAASQRVLSFIQSGSPGGNHNDYVQWGFDGDPSVTSVNTVRFWQGFGTVEIIISAGTTDIDTALDAGDPISVVPTGDIVTNVQTFIDGVAPECDIPTVVPCTTGGIDVTCTVRFNTGDKDTILAGQTLTQGQLVALEIERAIYKSGAGGRRPDPNVTQGYVLVKDMQDGIDNALGAGPTVFGQKLQIVTDRIVSNLDGGNVNKAMAPNVQPVPNTITITNLVE